MTQHEVTELTRIAYKLRDENERLQRDIVNFKQKAFHELDKLRDEMAKEPDERKADKLSMFEEELRDAIYVLKYTA